jgi:L-lactate dehydrogenase complex protein LldG
MVEDPLMSTARDEILGRIRSALRDVPKTEMPEDVLIDRTYRQSDPAAHDELVDQFVDRVAEYKAIVHRVRQAELPAAIASACAARGVRRLVVPRDLPAGWIPAGVEALRDPGLSHEQLDTSDGVLTACALGIAQTGTIVLDSGGGQGRRALSLVPDYHLCVVRVDQIVGLVPEAVQRLHSAASVPDRPLTWISGPSATSDIELNRVEGVHGPRTLEVLVVGE